MMSVRSNWPMFSALMRKYACSGMSTLTPGGMYTNEPPDHTAEFSAANLLSSGGMMVPKYSSTMSSCSRRPESIQEDDALLLEFLLQGVVDDLGLVLRPDACQALPLGLRDSQLLEGILDALGHVVPGAPLVLHRPDVVVDVVVVHLGEVAAPGGGRLLQERLQRLEAELEHPLGLVLMLGDHGHDLGVYTLPRGPEEVLLRVAETVLVLVEPEFLNSLVFRHSLVPSLALRTCAEFLAHPVVALLFQIVGELLAARGHEPAIEHDVHVIRLDVP